MAKVQNSTQPPADFSTFLWHDRTNECMCGPLWAGQQEAAKRHDVIVCQYKWPLKSDSVWLFWDGQLNLNPEMVIIVSLTKSSKDIRRHFTAHTHIYAHTYVHTHTNSRTHTHHIHTHVRTHMGHTSYMRMHTHTHMRTHTHSHVRTHTHTPYTCTHTFVEGVFWIGL